MASADQAVAAPQTATARPASSFLLHPSSFILPKMLDHIPPLILTRDEEAMRAFDAEVAAQRRTRANAPRVMFAVWTDPLYVGGRDTFTDDVLRLAGARNAVEVAGWPQYSLESLVASPPDIILYPRGAVTPQQVEALRKRVPELKAEIVAVDEDIFQRPGPRVPLAAQRLNAILDGYERGRMKDEGGRMKNVGER